MSISGPDWDEDGLGADLEAVLKTCDSPSSPTANGQSCRLHPSCTSSSGDPAVCRAVLRDSDRDGLPDDIELHGTYFEEHAATERMALWGADPARYDVFVETDRRGELVGGSCLPADGTTFSAAAWKSIVKVYRNVEKAENRDGSRGIFMHVSTHTPQPDRTDTRWGAFGGVEVLCGSKKDYPQRVAPWRRSLFRSLLLNGNAGSKTAGSPGLQSVASQPWLAAHELAHQGGLDHGGPKPHVGAINYSPFYLSRISYRYETFGNVEADPDTATEIHAADRIGFSRGRLGAFDPRHLDESCPLGPDADIGLLHGWNVHFDPATGCHAVDWNRDERFEPAGTTVTASVGESRMARQHEREGVLHSRAGAALGRAGTRWIRAAARGEGDTTVIDVHVNDWLDCGECPAESGPQYPACWKHGERTHVVSFEGGPPVRNVTALAGESVRFGDDWGTVLVYRGHDRVHFSVVDPEGALHYGGLIPRSMELSDDVDEHQLAMARESDTELSLAYRDRSGVFTTMTARVTSASPPRLEWSEPALTRIALAPGTSPGIARVSGIFGDRLLAAIPRRNATIGFFARTPKGEWAEWTALSIDVASVGARAKPELVHTRYDRERILVSWLGSRGSNDFVPQFQQTVPGVLGE